MQPAIQLDHTTQECFTKHGWWYALNTVLLNMPQETANHNITKYEIWQETMDIKRFHEEDQS